MNSMNENNIIKFTAEILLADFFVVVEDDDVGIPEDVEGVEVPEDSVDVAVTVFELVEVGIVVVIGRFIEK